MNIGRIMKARYIIPATEVLNVQGYVVLQSVSGGSTGLKEGGEDDGTHTPKAPRRPF